MLVDLVPPVHGRQPVQTSCNQVSTHITPFGIYHHQYLTLLLPYHSVLLPYHTFFLVYHRKFMLYSRKNTKPLRKNMKPLHEWWVLHQRLRQSPPTTKTVTQEPRSAEPELWVVLATQYAHYLTGLSEHVQEFEQTCQVACSFLNS